MSAQTAEVWCWLPGYHFHPPDLWVLSAWAGSLSSPPLPYSALPCPPPGWEQSENQVRASQAEPGFHTDKYLRQEKTNPKRWFSGAQRWTLFLFLYCLKYDHPGGIFNAHLDQNWSPLIKVFHLCRFWQRVTLSRSSPRVVIVCFREWVKTWELQVIIETSL